MHANESDSSWKCSRCGETVDADFDLCWNCGVTPDGAKIPDFVPETDVVSPPDDQTLTIGQTLKSTFTIAGLLCLLLIVFTIVLIILQDYLPPYFEHVIMFCATAVVCASLGLAVSIFVTLYDYKRTRTADKTKTFKPDLRKDKKICPNCLAPNFPREHFCVKCATPLTSHAEIDPLGQVYSMGDTYRKAAARPTRPAVFIGMWLLLGTQIPFLLIALLVNINAIFNYRPAFLDRDALEITAPIPLGPSTFAATGCILITGLLIAVYSAILYKLTKNYLRQRNPLKDDGAGGNVDY